NICSVIVREAGKSKDVCLRGNSIASLATCLFAAADEFQRAGARRARTPCLAGGCLRGIFASVQITQRQSPVRATIPTRILPWPERNPRLYLGDSGGMCLQVSQSSRPGFYLG